MNLSISVSCYSFLQFQPHSVSPRLRRKIDLRRHKAPLRVRQRPRVAIPDPTGICFFRQSNVLRPRIGRFPTRSQKKSFNKNHQRKFNKKHQQKSNIIQFHSQFETKLDIPKAWRWPSTPTSAGTVRAPPDLSVSD